MKKMNQKPSYVTSIFGHVDESSFTQEYPVNAVFPASAVTANGIQGKYTMDFKTFTGTFAAALVNVPLLTQYATTTVGQPGYSGKLKVCLERYQYMRITGFKLSYINTAPDGSLNAFSGQQTLMQIPSINFCVLPASLNGYNGTFSNLTNPNDVYSYDASLRVQPTNTTGIISRFFTLPKPPITGRANSNANNLNGWTNTNDLADYDVHIVMGWLEPPISASVGATPAPSFKIGTIICETFVEFAVPIKQQNI